MNIAEASYFMDKSVQFGWWFQLWLDTHFTLPLDTQRRGTVCNPLKKWPSSFVVSGGSKCWPLDDWTACLKCSYIYYIHICIYIYIIIYIYIYILMAQPAYYVYIYTYIHRWLNQPPQPVSRSRSRSGRDRPLCMASYCPGAQAR